MKLRKILCILLTLLMLTGCGLPPEQGDIHTEPILEPVSALEFRGSSVSPEVYVLDGRTAAFITTEYSTKENGEIYTRVRLLDLYTDVVSAETLLEGALAPLPYGGSTLALCDEITGRVVLMDRNLQQISTFRAEMPGGVISADLRHYYYIFGSALRCLDITTGEVKTVQLDWELPLGEITGYSPEENLLAVTAYTDLFSSDACVGVIELETATYRLVCDEPARAQLTAAGVCMETVYPEERTSDITYYSWSEEQMYRATTLLANNNDYSTWHIAGSDYIFQICYDTAQKTTIEDSRLLRLGEQLSVCSLQELLKGKKLTDFYSLPGGNLLALAVSRRGYQPFLICPEKLAFTEYRTVEATQAVLLEDGVRERYQNALDGAVLPVSLQQNRCLADELEETYGITILLSNQCAAPAAACSTKITTSDRAGLSDESERIRSALDALKNVLKMYPEGYFRQFQNAAGEQGILVMLVEDIGGDLNAVGVSYRLGQWYPVAVDITYWSIESTYHHEFWHATESKINETDPTLLSEIHWSSYNPAGFLYTQDQTGAYLDDLEYTLFGDQQDADTYFVDGYAKTFPYEDRARLMEYVMDSDRYARLIMKRPAMRNKLSCMAAAIREVFDTTGWGKEYWERYL